MAKKSKTTDDQKGRILEYQHFDLVSFKLKDEGLDMTYYNLLFPNSKEEPKSKIVAHPDLQKAMDKLKLYYATKIGILTGWDFARDNLRDNKDSLKLAVQGHKDTVDGCKITGLTFAGEGETYGVSIVGYHKFPQKGGSGLSSGKIVFGKSTLGYEKEVEELCEEIKKEVYSYRFQHKKAQLDIESENEKADNPDLFKKPENEPKEGKD